MNIPSEDIQQADILALHTLRALARQYQAVWVTISDCGCCTVELYINGAKIIEEDKSLAVAVGQVLERIGRDVAG